MNTYSLFNNDEVQSPMAIKSFDLWSYGQSAYIPSVRQLSYLFAVRHQINECITEVGGTSINLDPGECWLWSSTEVEGQKENKAWLYSMQSGTIQEGPLKFIYINLDQLFPSINSVISILYKLQY